MLCCGWCYGQVYNLLTWTHTAHLSFEREELFIEQNEEKVNFNVMYTVHSLTIKQSR